MDEIRRYSKHDDIYYMSLASDPISGREMFRAMLVLLLFWLSGSLLSFLVLGSSVLIMRYILRKFVRQRLVSRLITDYRRLEFTEP